MDNKNDREVIVYIILFLVGIISVLTAYFLKQEWQTVLLSVGTSIIAASVVSLTLRLILGDPFFSIVKSVQKATDVLDLELKGAVSILDRTSKTGVISVWSKRNELSSEQWIKLFSTAKFNLDFLAYAMAFLPEHPEFVELLLEKTKIGCRVRILLGDPDSKAVIDRNIEEKLEGSIPSRIKTSIVRLSPLIGRRNIEIRLHGTPLYCSIYRSDSDMLITPHVYGTRGAAAPLILLRDIKGGLFEQYQMHFESIWENAIKIKTVPDEYIRFT